MAAKTLLAIGNNELEEVFENTKDIDIIEKERDLETLKDLLEFINIDYLVINRLLDEDGENLLEVVTIAKKRNIKVVVLLNDIEDFKEKKIITALVAQDVYSFIRFNDVKEENIIKAITKYPEEFDFDILSQDENIETKIKASKDKATRKPLTVEVELINNAVITVFSNCSSGKSTLSWILSYCFEQRNYKTAVINLDKGYSANIYYDIKNEEHNGSFDINQLIKNEEIGYRVNKNLCIISGTLGSKVELQPDQFMRLLNNVRVKNNITIIDCKSELSMLTRMAIQQSTIDLFIYDNDINHCSLNNEMIQELGNDFNPEKTVVVINNAALESKSHREVLEYLQDSGLSFRNILTVRSIGGKIYDLVNKGISPYVHSTIDEGFKNDIDNLMVSIKSRDYKKVNFIKKKKFKIVFCIVLLFLSIYFIYRFKILNIIRG